MKLKFMIMLQALYFLAKISLFVYYLDFREEIEENFGHKFIISFTVYAFVFTFEAFLSLGVYCTIYHSLKRIDDDDRRHMFPDHNYTPDELCQCNCLKFGFWTVYVVCFLFLSLLCWFSATIDGSGSGSTTFRIFAFLVFGGMLCHQCYYKDDNNKVKGDNTSRVRVLANDNNTSRLAKVAPVAAQQPQMMMMQQPDGTMVQMVRCQHSDGTVGYLPAQQPAQQMQQVQMQGDGVGDAPGIGVGQAADTGK